MKKFLRTLTHSLTRHLFLKIISLLLALVIWAYIVSTTPSLTRNKHLTGLNVYVTGETELSKYGLALATDVYTQYQNQLDAYVTVSLNQFAKVTNRNVSISLDVSHIRTAGEQKIPLTAYSIYGEVTRLYPDTITVNVEPLDSRDIPVTVQLTNKDEENYWYNLPEENINPQQITISGPVSLIQNIVNVVGYVDVSNTTTSIRRGALLTLQDSSENQINTRLLSKSASTCSTRLEVYPIKKVPVTLDASQLKIADGYQVDDIILEPSTVTIAGPASLLDTIEQFSLEVPANLKAISRTYRDRWSVQGRDEVKYYDTSKVAVTVTVSEIRDTVTFSDQPISIFGLNKEKYSVTLSPSTFSAQLSVPHSQADTISADDIGVFVDLSNYGEGSYDLPLQYGNNFSFSVVSITPTTVHVEITAADAAENVETEVADVIQ